MKTRKYDFTLTPLMIGQPPYPIYSLAPWTIAAEQFLDDMDIGEPFLEYCVALERKDISAAVDQIRAAGLKLAGDCGND